MKKLFFCLLLASPVTAGHYPSKISIALEGGAASGSIPDYNAAGVYGGRIVYDFNDRWSFGAHFQGRNFR